MKRSFLSLARGTAAALALAVAMEGGSAAAPPFVDPSEGYFIREDVVDAPIYHSERWGIRIVLPKPNVWCGTSGSTDRGGTIVFRADANCESGSARSDLVFHVRPRFNVSGIDDDVPPIREVIARHRCGAPAKNDPSFRVLPRVAGLPAFECFGYSAARGPHRELFELSVILLRGDKSKGYPGRPPYPSVEYELSITTAPEREAEARALMAWMLERVTLRPL
jgi:hypothetical protein